MGAKTFAAVFKEARMKRGLTQLELAQKSGVSYWTIIKLESGARHPNVNTLMRVRAVLKDPRLLDLALFPA